MGINGNPTEDEDLSDPVYLTNLLPNVGMESRGMLIMDTLFEGAIGKATCKIKQAGFQRIPAIFQTFNWYF